MSEMATTNDGLVDSLHLLIVCTANRCRSPIAATWLRSKVALDEVARDRIEVRSAGFLEPGQAVPELGVALMAHRAVDVSGHRSATLDRAILEWADLILPMERTHVRRIVAGVPELWSRTFTIKEFVRRATQVGPRAAGTQLDVWLAEVGAGRRLQDLVGPSADDDVRDPFAAKRRVWQSVIDELDGLTAQVVTLLGVTPDRGQP
jgi:protein-tyrosine phosphatase